MKNLLKLFSALYQKLAAIQGVFIQQKWFNVIKNNSFVMDYIAPIPFPPFQMYNSLEN